MTNRELQEKLKELPEDLEVMYEDGEYGNTDISYVKIDKYDSFDDVGTKIEYISLK